MNTQEVRALTHRLRAMEPDALIAFGEEYKANPIVFPLVFTESMFRKGLDRQKAMQQGDTKPVNEQALESMYARATPMPEEVGIGALPAGNMDYAEGGIVAFAGGGYNEMGDEGRLQILAQEMRQAQQRLAQGDARAQGDIDALTREIGRIKKTPSIAAKLTSALPMGSAQAAPVQQPAPAPSAAPADAPSVYTGPGYTTEGLEALGQRLDVIREARSKAKPPTLRERQADPEAAKRYQALQDLNLGAQREYEKYAENIYNKPAFAAPSAGGKGVGTTTLPAAQAVAKEVAAPDIAAQEDRRAGTEVALPESGEYRGKSGDVEEDIGPAQPALSPKQEKQIIAAAKEAVPEGIKTKGWTSEDWLTFGFSLLSSESPYFMNALGKAGAAVQPGRQAREKTGLEALKTKQDIESSKALARKYGAEAETLEAETKTDAALRMKAATLAQQELEKWQALPQNFSVTPAQVAAKRQELFSIYTAALRQQDTIGAGAATGIAAPQGVKVTRIGP